MVDQVSKLKRIRNELADDIRMASEQGIDALDPVQVAVMEARDALNKALVAVGDPESAESARKHYTLEELQAMKAGKIIVRRLSEGDMDWALLTALSNLSKVGIGPTDARRLHAERESAGTLTYGCFDSGSLLGTISLVVERKLIRNGGLCGHIEDVAVATGQEGQGIGKSLIEHAVAECRRLGCYKVILDCSADLAGFYGKCGFREAGICMRLDLK